VLKTLYGSTLDLSWGKWHSKMPSMDEMSRVKTASRSSWNTTDGWAWSMWDGRRGTGTYAWRHQSQAHFKEPSFANFPMISRSLCMVFDAAWAHGEGIWRWLT